jgi:hypothetical protein
MYAALWRVLPGRTWVKVLQLLVLASVVIVVLFTWLFPLVANTFLVEQSVVGP